MNKHEQQGTTVYSNWNKHELSKHYENVVASLEGFILFLKLDYYFFLKSFLYFN